MAARELEDEFPDEVDGFICYHCKEGDCPSCVGVPCLCECPYGRTEHAERCTFKGCENQGIPQKGFDFFICDSCFVEFERLLREKAAEKASPDHA